jgi:hypothetical protein
MFLAVATNNVRITRKAAHQLGRSRAGLPAAAARRSISNSSSARPSASKARKLATFEANCPDGQFTITAKKILSRTKPRFRVSTPRRPSTGVCRCPARRRASESRTIPCEWKLSEPSHSRCITLDAQGVQRRWAPMLPVRKRCCVLGLIEPCLRSLNAPLSPSPEPLLAREALGRLGIAACAIIVHTKNHTIFHCTTCRVTRERSSTYVDKAYSAGAGRNPNSLLRRMSILCAIKPQPSVVQAKNLSDVSFHKPRHLLRRRA